MHEEAIHLGVLTDREPGLPGQGPDPMDAVLAVSEPRDAAAAEAAPKSVAEVTVTTSVGLDSPERAADAGDDGYGDFAWPEGYAADPEAMARFLPLAKRLGLSKESAQELATLHAALDQDRRRAQEDFVARNNAEWVEEIRAHPEFGGQSLRRAGEGVAAMFRRYGSPLLTDQIRRMHIQNWPEMFYFLARISRAVSEDVSPANHGSAATRSTAELLFPGLK